MKNPKKGKKLNKVNKSFKLNLIKLKQDSLYEIKLTCYIYREIVLGKLDQLVKEFVKQVSIARGLPEYLAASAGGKIFTFGSYRLGVHSAGADIDTLCVVPRHVQRETFFTVMFDLLKARSEVTDLAVNKRKQKKKRFFF